MKYNAIAKSSKYFSHFLQHGWTNQQMYKWMLFAFWKLNTEKSNIETNYYRNFEEKEKCLYETIFNSLTVKNAVLFFLSN